MPSTIVGYARTSTRDQVAGLEAQLRDLKAAGVEKTFHEQLSSVDSERVELAKALDYVREGDTLVVTKLDRLARSIRDMVRIVEELERKSVNLKILAMNLDTSTPTGKLLLNLVGSVAQFEREIMLERQREGIAKAKADGRYRGRAPTAKNKTADILRLRAEGKTVNEIVSTLNVSRSSIFRIFKAPQM